MNSLWASLRATAALCGCQRKLWLPFLAAALVESLLIGLIWLAPHPPFSPLLAPPIRYFFGDRVLHYPAHLWFLYRAMKHTHLIASILAGACCTGLACAMVRQTYEGVPLSLRTALVSRQVPYRTVLFLWVFLWVAARGMIETMTQLMPKAAWVIWTGVGLTLMWQALLVYAIPIAVFRRVSWWKALVESVRETLRYPMSTLVIVSVPSAALVLFTMLAPAIRVAQWMGQAVPEVALLFIAGRLLVWMVADAVLTVAIAHLWWLHRRAAPAPAPATAAPVMPGVRLGASMAALWIVGLAGVLLSAGCSASYSGERLFWKAQHRAAPIGKDLSHATPEQFAKAIEAFDQVVRRTPQTVWAPRAHLAIGSLYARQKRYGKAREAYGLMLQNYNQYRELDLVARRAIARTYELEQQWDEAIKAYEDLASHHPFTLVGLETPLYVAQLVERHQGATPAANAYERAVRTYIKLIPQAPRSELASQVKGFLAIAYQRLGQWNQAVEILEELAKLTTNANRPLVLLTLGSIYQMKLGQADNAKAAYTTLVQEFPDHPLVKAANEQLAKLGQSATGLPPSTSPQGGTHATSPELLPTPPAVVP